MKINVEFEALDGERVWATGQSLELLIKGLKTSDQMKDKIWTIRTLEVA